MLIAWRLAAQHCSQLRLQDLDRDLPFVPDVVRQIHGRHPARAKFPFDAVAIGESGRKSLRNMHPDKVLLAGLDRETS
jgi:hypothetical protein